MARYVDFNPILTPDGQLDQLPVGEGNFIITDEGKIYVDIGKGRMPVSGEKGERGDPGLEQVSPDTSVADIPDGKILSVLDGKITGIDVPSGGGISEISLSTPVADIPDGEILMSKDGKVAGIDIPEGLEPVIIPATATKPGVSGTAYKLATSGGQPTGPHYIRFTATALYSDAYEYTLNGTAVTIKTRNGEPLRSPWKIGDEVMLFYSGGVLYFDQGNSVVRNLIPRNPSSTWFAGITTTAQPDGSVKISGTSTAAVDAFMFGAQGGTANFGVLQAGKTYYFDPGPYIPGTRVYLVITPVAGGSAITLEGRAYVSYTQDYKLSWMYLRVDSGAGVNFIWSPALYLVDVPDSDYMPSEVFDAFRVPKDAKLEIYHDPFVCGIPPGAFTYVNAANVPRGKRYERKWVPDTSSAGSQAAIIEAYRGSAAIWKKPVTLDVFEKPGTLDAMSVMVIGDSLIESGAPEIFTQIRSMCTDDYGESKFTFVGTKGSGSNKHEGRGGWHVVEYNSNKAGNPFWNAATGKLDFANYSAVNGITPDVVCIMLGTNDVLTGNAPTVVMQSFKAITNRIRGDWPSAKILIAIPPLPGTQDGLANASFTGRMNNIRFRYGQYASVLYESYRQSGGIAITPVFYCFDNQYNYPVKTEPVNPFSAQTVTAQADNIHPSAEGNKQLGAIWYWSLLSLFA